MLTNFEEIRKERAMELTERKKKVLRSVVDLYIRTAEPVGSKAITALPDMRYSSATIRNEMADLTAMGYLEQPHTSAGRVPSAAGYRLYVDELMADYRLSMDETRSINSAIEEKMQQVDKMMEKVASLVSQATDLPAISMASRQAGVTVKRFDLILAGSGSFILVLLLSTDEVVNKLIKLPLPVTDGDLKVLSAVLNAAMADIPAEELTGALMDKIMRSAGAAASLVPVIFEFTADALRRHANANMAVAGQLRLLGQPEYRDVDKVQRLLTSLDEEALSQLPAVIQGANGTQVLVGPENVAQELKDTSVVVTKFDIGEGLQGMIGVVGPTRMDYAKVTARLSYFAESLSKLFAKPEQTQPQLPAGENHNEKP
ncbi:MAG TPA: heat-inducible transcription repressor HrcA [Candidatus Faecousia intestinigallinarum]|nr:heat-inducible transcription repressor HrcA [Candidatus Faecousia intestinigallinarum]